MKLQGYFHFVDRIHAGFNILASKLLKRTRTKFTRGRVNEDTSNSDTVEGEGEYDLRESIEDYSETNETILKYMLFRTDGIIEISVHQLAYSIDVLSVNENNEQLLDAEYTPDHHGVYSTEISRQLQHLAENGEIETLSDMYQGELITRYNKSDHVDDIDESQKCIIEHILSESNERVGDPSELVEIVRKHPTRKSTEFGQTIELSSDPVSSEHSSTSVGDEDLWDNILSGFDSPDENKDE